MHKQIRANNSSYLLKLRMFSMYYTKVKPKVCSLLAVFISWIWRSDDIVHCDYYLQKGSEESDGACCHGEEWLLSTCIFVQFSQKVLANHINWNRILHCFAVTRSVSSKKLSSSTRFVFHISDFMQTTTVAAARTWHVRSNSIFFFFLTP